jgi:hypothetical protein
MLLSKDLLSYNFMNEGIAMWRGKYDKNWYKQIENVGTGNLKPILDIYYSILIVFFFSLKN